MVNAVLGGYEEEKKEEKRKRGGGFIVNFYLGRAFPTNGSYKYLYKMGRRYVPVGIAAFWTSDLRSRNLALTLQGFSHSIGVSIDLLITTPQTLKGLSSFHE